MISLICGIWKTNQTSAQKQTHRYKGHFDGCQMGGALEEWMKKVKELKTTNMALAAVAQWIECWPVNQRVTSSIPNQGTCLGCGPGPH